MPAIMHPNHSLTKDSRALDSGFSFGIIAITCIIVNFGLGRNSEGCLWGMYASFWELGHIQLKFSEISDQI